MNKKKNTTLKNYIVIPLKNLVKANWNYKHDEPKKAEKLKANFMRNGQIQNLIVRELDTGYYEVVNGNHRVDVMVDLNMDSAVCYNLGNITLQHAQRIAIETNETNFKNDSEKLNGLLMELSQQFEDLQDTLTMDLTHMVNNQPDIPNTIDPNEKFFFLNIELENETQCQELYEEMAERGYKVKIIT